MTKNINFKPYYFGFGFSLLLTLTSFFLVHRHIASRHLIYNDILLLGLIMALAITQLIVQLIFFLHLNKESKPWWDNMALIFALLVVVILVFGSMWIMVNLNYHHVTNMTHDGHNLSNPQQVNQYIIQDEGVQP